MKTQIFKVHFFEKTVQNTLNYLNRDSLMSNQTNKASEKKKHFIGMILLALGMFVFVSINALMKTVEQSYPILQLVFFRGAFSLLPCIIVLAINKDLSQLKISNMSIHLIRASLGVVSLTCLFKSVLILPLAEATVYMFTSALFVTAFAFPMLGEKVGLSKWGCVLLGFIGVLIISKPSSELFNWGVIFGLTSAVIEALTMVHNRKLSIVNGPAVIVFYYALFSSLICGVIMPFVWLMPTSYDLLVLIALGVGGGVGQYLVSIAYSYTPAGSLSPLLYTSMIWSLSYGILFFNEIPDLAIFLGGSLILLANFFVILQENKKNFNKTI